MRRRILVADDNDLNRMLLNKILSDEYEIVEAKNGKEALEILKNESHNLSAMLLDIIMPELDGFEVLTCMRNDADIVQIPVIVTTGNTEEGAEVKALSLGANDYIMKPYNPAIIKHRLHNTIHLRENVALVNIIKRDKLTGLYNREAFFERAEELIAKHQPGYFVMSCFDIDNFKVINDQFGTEKGDFVLRYLAKLFKTVFGAVGGICCRIMADHFAVLFPRYFINSEELRKLRTDASVLDGSFSPITFSIGHYLVDDISLPASAMYDRASIAEASVKGRFDTNIAWYDESMRVSMLREQEIVSEMNSALENKQFEVWFQPQYNVSTNALIGAEALVRWRHPRKGLVPPGVFIPVFENNGFVYEVDKFVWEQTCKYLRGWLDSGRSPLPVSVNISRYDVFRDDFLDVITTLTYEYGIPVNLLRLEITESAFAQSTGQIIRVARRLTELGFTLEIDDFGSGYSSLNTLKDVPADIIKLDMRFLECSEEYDNSSRGGNIIQSVIRMAKWLGMSVIAEGVEDREQVDYLQSIGCNYVQGYYYGKPMPISEYEALAATVEKEEKLLVLETVENLDNNAFWDPKSMDTLIFNSYVGGACIFEYDGSNVDMLRVNKKCVRILGGKYLTADDVIHINWNEHVVGENRVLVRNAMRRSIETGEEVSCEAIFSNMHEEHTQIFFRASMRMIAHVGSRYLFYCLVDDLTAQHEAEQKEHLAKQQLQVIMNNVNGGITAAIINSDTPVLLFANEQYYSQLGYTREQFKSEVKSAFQLVHPDDRERVAETTKQASINNEPFSIIYRAVRRDGESTWMQSNISITEFPGIDETVQLAVANDITALRNAEINEHIAIQRVQSIMNNVNSGVAAVMFDNTGRKHTVFTNNRYYSLIGYTKEQYESEVEDYFDIVSEDDRERISESIEDAVSCRKPVCYEYRCNTRDGGLVYLRCNASITEIDGIGDTVLLEVITDITELANAERQLYETSEQLRFLNDTAHDLLADAENGIEHVLEKILDYFGGSRAYIFEIGKDEKLASNTYEVCAEGCDAEKEDLQNVPLELYPHWLWVLKNGRYLNIENVNKLGESSAEEKKLLQSQNVNSLIAVPFNCDGRLMGYIGVDDPTRQQNHIENLKAIGDYIAVIIKKRDLDLKIRNDNMMLKKLMNDIPGGFARVKVNPRGELTIIYADDGYCELRGMNYGTLTSMKGDAMDSIHPDDVEMVRETVSNLIETGGSASISYRLKRSDGKYIKLKVSGRVSKTENGDIYLNVFYAE